LGDICQDISCLIIKEIEKKNLGIIFRSNVSNEMEQCISVSFVNDNDLVIDRENAEEKIQEIIDIYETLHIVTGGKIEGKKTKYYAWQ